MLYEPWLPAVKSGGVMLGSVAPGPRPPAGKCPDLHASDHQDGRQNLMGNVAAPADSAREGRSAGSTRPVAPPRRPPLRAPEMVGTLSRTDSWAARAPDGTRRRIKPAKMLHGGRRRGERHQRGNNPGPAYRGLGPDARRGHLRQGTTGADGRPTSRRAESCRGGRRGPESSNRSQDGGPSHRPQLFGSASGRESAARRRRVGQSGTRATL